ncbi:MAG: DNA-directed RNA polymerase I [Lachnospiraceae bacterium]|nr:DNA-directed RNA polymerase I [Lachnospiraceae bacterium]
MGAFTKAWIDAQETGRYECSQCGAAMEFEDEWEETLICPECGHEVDIDRYGAEDDETYEALYPTKEEVCGYDD